MTDAQLVPFGSGLELVPCDEGPAGLCHTDVWGAEGLALAGIDRSRWLWRGVVCRPSTPSGSPGQTCGGAK